MRASSQTQQIDPQETNDASPPIVVVTDGTAIETLQYMQRKRRTRGKLRRVSILSYTG
jgi:hypothetical protein